MHDHRPALRQHGRVRLAGVVLVVASACGGAGSETQPPPFTTVPSPEATAPTTTAATDPVAAYRAYWDAFLQASNPVDPQNPLLIEHTTGRALATLQEAFRDLIVKGQVIRGDLDLAPRLISVEGDAAVVNDCYGDGTGFYDITTGARLDAATGKRHKVTAKLLRIEGVWTVEHLTDGGLGCTAP